MTYAENIIRVFEQASDTEYREGFGWYDKYREVALSLSPGDVWRGAGIIAAYSPNNYWDRNIFLATESLRNGVARTDYFGNQVAKVERMLNGEHPLDVLKGDKERAFAAAIADPYTDIATIDRHAHDIAMGRVFADRERKIGKVLFRTISEHYRQASFEAGITVSQIQAITWVVWRNRK